MNHQIQPLRRYRAILVPANVPAEQVEPRADRGDLPTLQFRAPSAAWAERTAHMVSGLPVLRVERVEG